MDVKLRTPGFSVRILFLQGVKAIIAESYERIHRSNLIGMGIAPLQYLSGQNADTLGLTGRERFTIDLSDTIQPGDRVTITVSRRRDVANTALQDLFCFRPTTGKNLKY